MNQLERNVDDSSVHYISLDEQMTVLPTSLRCIVRTQGWQQCRTFTTSARKERSRDVMAKYRRPIQTFDTISTIPAASSFQTVPPPTASKDGVRKAIPIPAMATPTSDTELNAMEKVEEKDKEMIVQGIVIPPKPVPPKDDGMSLSSFTFNIEVVLMSECCMNSCVNCVYNLYADDLEAYTSALDEAHSAVISANIPISQWPEAVRKLDGNKSGKEGVRREEMGKMEDGMDPVVLAFLDMERRLKKKQLDKGT